MKNYFLFLLLVLFLSISSQAQKKKPVNSVSYYTTADERWIAYQKRKELREKSWLTNIPFRNIGPTVMSGRVVDIEVNPANSSHFYVAYASGGLWETKNEGASFTPLFDQEAVMTIGDIAVHWASGTIYVGTGENNSSRSSYSGVGVFQSKDGGKNWQHLGLDETHHIGRILLHPTDPNTLWIAALGHLYSENGERGIYKTTDGGKNWQQTLYINKRTGVADLIINPSDPNVLIAAAWEKDRKAWNFVEAGLGSGLYKSTDGGESWSPLAEIGSGFPDTPDLGRIGLSWVADGTILAVVDNQSPREKELEKESEVITRDQLRAMSIDQFVQLDNKKINSFLDQNSFPTKYNAPDLKEDMKKGKFSPKDLVMYLEDANTLLLNSEVVGGEVYVSKDGGETWKKTHNGYLDQFVNTYGYYFGQIRHNPLRTQELYILGVPILFSPDAGASWQSINGDNVHADHHALWVSPSNDGHLILGNDGGINISKDNGKTWTKCNSIPVGQFYSVNIDHADPYNVYGGLQDNGVWKGPSTYEFSNEWQASGHYPYSEIMGGDGMQVQVDPRDNVTVYTGYQFGNYFRLNTMTNERKYITPRHELGESPYRWNWQAPILLSVHNPDIVYFGSNRFHRSLNKGEKFETLSGDLTGGGKKGDVSFGTLTTISESPTRFGLIYVGSDDGLIHLSKDGGNTWQKISNGIPANKWVTRVVASSFNEGRVYASLNGYRDDDFKSYVYVSEDYGSTWKSIHEGLPSEPVNVIKEDTENENILYVGTDHGLYATLDKGTSWMVLGDLPAVAIHDLVIQPKAKDLVVGTHGRSLFVAKIAHLQKLEKSITDKSLHVFDIPSVNYSARWGSSWWQWGEPQEPSIDIPVFSKNSGKVNMQISIGDTVAFSKTYDIQAGLNYISYNGQVSESSSEAYKKKIGGEISENWEKAKNGNYYLLPGKHKVKITSGTNELTSSLEVKSPKERAKRKE